MTKRIAVFPGSFDPITNGHFDIVQRALPLFDEILIAIGVNSNKKYMFSLEQRMAWITKSFVGESKIKVMEYSGLTVAFCETVGAQFILRGLRNPADFEFEKGIAQANRKLLPKVESVFLLTGAGFSYVSSSIVRDVMRNHGDYTHFVPNAVRVPEGKQ